LLLFVKISCAGLNEFPTFARFNQGTGFSRAPERARFLRVMGGGMGEQSEKCRKCLKLVRASALHKKRRPA
jgi:hypothetical protein